MVQRIPHVETGGENSDVRRVQRAVSGADAGRLKTRDAIRDEGDMVLREAGIKIIGKQHAFAAKLEARQEFGA
jgi:hypothetical protein